MLVDSIYTKHEQRLAPDGVFVVEAFVPDLSRFDHGQRMSVIHLDTDQIGFDAVKLDNAKQLIRANHVRATAEGMKLYPIELRFAYPSELDLMARLAGMH